MTTIAFGGGPSLEQRRTFCQLKEGTQVPGYRGYIPQIKYQVGQTYGNDTHVLLRGEHKLQRSITFLGTIPQDILRNEIPDATGDNKYTKCMVPGYTGYIPRMPFKFGGTYKDECDVCIDQFLTNSKNHTLQLTNLNTQVRSYPRLTSISYDPSVRDKLNLYRDTHPSQPLMQEDKRAMTEAPMPGYQGYVPRIKPTDIGLGQRFHISSKKGFEAFAHDQQKLADLRTGNYEFTVRPPSNSRLKSAPAISTRRLYQQDGMIPKYTGYIPQRRYAFGNTYGDTTRSLEVCAHDKESYSTHVRSMKSVRFSQPCA